MDERVEILVKAVIVAQAKGAYSLEDAALLYQAIKSLQEASKPQPAKV